MLGNWLMLSTGYWVLSSLHIKANKQRDFQRAKPVMTEGIHTITECVLKTLLKMGLRRCRSNNAAYLTISFAPSLGFSQFLTSVPPEKYFTLELI